MSDTAHVEIQSPTLDLDAMLADLHNDFQGEVDDEAAAGNQADASTGDDAGSTDGGDDHGTATGDGETGGTEGLSPDLDSVLPPGMVQFGDEILPQSEVEALLNLNRRVKADPDTASRVRQAIVGQETATQTQGDPDALPEWLDPEDQQAVFMYRHSQRIERELEEVKRNEAQRQQQLAQAQESQRVTEVRDAFRVSMKEFRDEHPMFDLTDLNAIANRAASMGLLQNPEAVGGTLKGGIVTALETAMWATPEYREKAAAGATVRTKEQESQTRKQKSSALSSSTGSVVRTQSQEPTPTNRKEVMAGALDFLRSGAVTD